MAKDVDEQLRDFQTKFEYIGSPILVIDGLKEQVIFGNLSCQELMGYSNLEMGGLAFVELFSRNEARIKAISSIIAEAEGEIELQEHDLMIRKKSGRLSPVNLSIKTYVLAGRVIGICSISDLTKVRVLENERKEMMKKVSHASKLADIGRLAAGVAHEINNPLMIVQGYSENLDRLIKTEPFDATAGQESLDRVLSATNRMAMIIRQMTRISRSDELQIQTLRMADMINDSLSMMAGQLEAAQVTVSTEIQKDIHVPCDEAQMEQIIMNLLSNASHALEEVEGDRKIRITIGDREGIGFVRVWNNGPHITSLVREKLMTPFFTTKRVGQGTGLGLYVSQGIMRAHGGDLVCDTPDAGCSFTIHVPIDGTKKRYEGELTKALVVEDEDDIRSFLVTLIRQRGLTVEGAKDGVQALKMIRQDGDYNLIVTDLRMPEMDGIDFVRNLNFSHPHARVIVVSGLLREYQMELAGLRTEAMFSKPLDIPKFNSAIDQLIKAA